MIMLFGGEKGGTGKTTLAINIACMAAVVDGVDLLLVDTDKQKTASVFYSVRQEGGIKPDVLCMEKRGKTLGKDLQALSQKYDLVVVDAGGQDSPELRYAMVVADEMYVPCQPSQADLWTLEWLDNLITEVHTINSDLKVFSVLNRCSNNPRNTDADEAAEYFNNFETMNLLSTRLRDRVVFQRALRTGQSVYEYAPQDKGSNELLQLYKEIMY